MSYQTSIERFWVSEVEHVPAQLVLRWVTRSEPWVENIIQLSLSGVRRVPTAPGIEPGTSAFSLVFGCRAVVTQLGIESMTARCLVVALTTKLLGPRCRIRSALRLRPSEAPHRRATTALRRGFVPVGAIAVGGCGSRTEPSIRARAGGKAKFGVVRRR